MRPMFVLPLFCVALLAFNALAARAGEVIVGMNLVNPMRASVERQNVTLAQLKAAGVRFIRAGVGDGAAGVDFIRRAQEQGIGVLLILDFRYPADAPTRPYMPKQFPGMWPGRPLSSADPALSRSYFQSVLTRIDRMGIKLAGLELGNEINWAAFNQDFPLPGENKAFALADLERDAEGRQIARGFDQYVRVAAALREVRDRLEVNRETPILSAGLVAFAEDYAPPNQGADVVYQSAAISYLRAHGLDEAVDAYGVHSYPSSEGPDNPAAAARRLAHFRKYDLAACRAPGASDGKPCWITEWGFQNGDLSCPPDERKRSALIGQMEKGFREAAERNVLAGLFYFSWDSDPWSKEVGPYSVFRCDRLTSSGEIAIGPLTAK